MVGHREPFDTTPSSYLGRRLLRVFGFANRRPVASATVDPRTSLPERPCRKTQGADRPPFDTPAEAGYSGSSVQGQGDPFPRNMRMVLSRPR